MQPNPNQAPMGSNELGLFVDDQPRRHQLFQQKVAAPLRELISFDHSIGDAERHRFPSSPYNIGDIRCYDARSLIDSQRIHRVAIVDLNLAERGGMRGGWELIDLLKEKYKTPDHTPPYLIVISRDGKESFDELTAQGGPAEDRKWPWSDYYKFIKFPKADEEEEPWAQLHLSIKRGLAQSGFKYKLLIIFEGFKDPKIEYTDEPIGWVLEDMEGKLVAKSARDFGQKSHRSRVFQFLARNSGKEFNVDDIVKEPGMIKDSIRADLSTLKSCCAAISNSNKTGFWGLHALVATEHILQRTRLKVNNTVD